MVRNILKKILIILPLFLYISCDRLEESSTLISGNQKFRSGNYQGAIIDYLKGLDSNSYKDYFYYNLGNVYSSMGESPAAFSIWNLADGQSNTQLKFNLLYNKGVLDFQEGNYEKAYNHFRQALTLVPSDVKAKINLELSLNKMSAATYNKISDSKNSSNNSSDEKGASDETTRILEYVKQKEVMTWGDEYQESEQVNDW